MSSKIKNAIIFLSIGIVLILVYVFLIRQPADQGNLVSTGVDTLQPAPITPATPSLDQDFLPLLLSVKSMTLNDDIFKNKAFESLSDTSIDLNQDSPEGRSNPFASFGSDDLVNTNSNLTLPIDLDTTIPTTKQNTLLKNLTN